MLGIEEKDALKSFGMPIVLDVEAVCECNGLIHVQSYKTGLQEYSPSLLLPSFSKNSLSLHLFSLPLPSLSCPSSLSLTHASPTKLITQPAWCTCDNISDTTYRRMSSNIRALMRYTPCSQETFFSIILLLNAITDVYV